MKTLTFAIILVCSPALAGHAADAKTIWVDQCVKCHGADGNGATKMGKKLGIKDYTDAQVQAGFTDEQAFRALKDGMKDKSGATRMKPVDGLSDADINSLVAFVRSLKK